MSGFVSFVSAGPGDPDLLTLKALARLRDADVVLYDDLASGAILDHARPGANLVAVGKRAGRPRPSSSMSTACWSTMPRRRAAWCG